MKKLLGLVLALGLFFGVTGQAMAAFDKDDLLVTFYNSAKNEVTIDLGNFYEITAEAGTHTLYTGLIYDSTLTGAALSSSRLAIYGGNILANTGFFALTTSTLSSGSTGYFGNMDNFNGAVDSLYSNYGAATDTNKYSGSSTATVSYYKKMDNSSANVGKFKSFNSYNASYGEPLLTTLGTSTGSITMYLYYATQDNVTLIPALVAGRDGNQYSSILTLTGDGTITITNPAVPIPASVLLLGSGLLGLFGIKRKNSLS
jgi:hypothetical protein